MIPFRRLLPWLLILGAAPAAAEDWLACREQILAAAKPRSFNCLFRLGQASGDWPRAARELAAFPRGAEEASWVANLAAVLDQQHGCGRSESRFRRAAELFAADGNLAGELYAREYELRCLETRDPEAARREGAALSALAERSGNPALVAQAAIRRAQLALTAVALAEAEQLLAAHPLPSLDALDPPRPALGRDWLIQHGRLCYALGRNEAALRDSLLRIERAQDGGDEAQVARASFDAAAMLTSFPPGAANAARIRTLAAAALEIAERRGDRGLTAAALLLLGRLDHDAGLLRRCGEAAASDGELAACRFAEASAIAAADREQAAVLLAEGEAAAARAEAPMAALQPWSDRLRAVFAVRPRAAALAAAGELLAQAERLRAAETRPGRGAELFGVWREIHDWLAGRLLESGEQADLELAFLLLENGRARELRDSLGAQAPVRELREIEAGLGPHEALLTFLLDHERDPYGNPDGGAAIFLSTRQGTRVLPLPGRERIDPAIALLLGEIAARRESPQLARQLGELILGPAEQVLPAGITRLILVPDGSLFRLPWALLRGQGGELLARRFELVIAPAASLLPRAAEPGEPGALIFADPAFAAAPASDSAGGGAAARGIWGGGGRQERLARLPLARREGSEVRRLLGGRLLADEAATEAALLAEKAPRYGVLHFAAHAVLDDELPERSALLLAPAAGDGGAAGADGSGDGRLEPREIAALRLEGRLVTLAGCRSAAGRIVPGEGPMSLGRAFLAAGAPAVIGSLWELRDDEAADFFGRFYRHLAGGQRTAAALAAAQQEMAAEGAPAAAWAGVVLLGDGDFRLRPAPPLDRALRFLYRPGPLLAAAALLLLAAIAAARR